MPQIHQSILGNSSKTSRSDLALRRRIVDHPSCRDWETFHTAAAFLFGKPYLLVSTLAPRITLASIPNNAVKLTVRCIFFAYIAHITSAPVSGFVPCCCSSVVYVLSVIVQDCNRLTLNGTLP
jgi:hypothetical protein